MYSLIKLKNTMKLDQYYTNPKIAKKCCRYFNKIIKIDKNDLIIEPSAGNGSFIPYIQQLSNNNIFLDISPKQSLIQKQNFLTYILPEETKTYRKIYAIGNPPFGFKSSTAIKFIKHICKFCDAFGLILPKSFMKRSMQKSVPLNFHLKGNLILPPYSFIKNKHMYNVPSVFQIWCKGDRLRKQTKKYSPIGYVFVRKNDNPNIAIRRVGSNTGYVYQDNLHLLNASSHYFIQIKNKKNINKIRNIRSLSRYHVSGPLSISKQSIIKHLNNMLKAKI